MMLKKLFIFVGIMLLLISGAVILFGADFSDLYWGTAYKRILVLRDDTALTGLHATTPEGVFDGEFNAAPFSLSQEEMLFNTDKQLQFRDGNMFIHSDGATSLTIDGNADLKLTGTAITLTGVVAIGEVTITGTGTSAIDAVPIGGTTPAAGDFTNITATGTLDITGVTTAAAITADGDIAFDGGKFIFNDSGADLDFYFEGDGDANLLFGDAGNDRIGIGTAAPSHTLDVNGTLEVTGASTLTGAVTSAGGFVGDLTGDVTGDVTSAGTSGFAVTTHSGASTFSGTIEMASDFYSNGNKICLDGDEDTYWQAAVDGIVILTIETVSEITIDNDGIFPSSDGGAALGKDGTLEWSDVATQDLHVSDDATIDDLLTANSISVGAIGISGTIDAVAAAVFNADGGDFDTTIRSDDNAIAFVVDASEDNVEFGAAFSYNATQAFADVDETPSVAGYTCWNTGSAAETITSFDDPNPQQRLIILSKAAITFDFDDVNLSCGTADLVTAAGDITEWIYLGSTWYLTTYIDVGQDINTW